MLLFPKLCTHHNISASVTSQDPTTSYFSQQETSFVFSGFDITNKKTTLQCVQLPTDKKRNKTKKYIALPASLPSGLNNDYPTLSSFDWQYTQCNVTVYIYSQATTMYYSRDEHCCIHMHTK